MKNGTKSREFRPSKGRRRLLLLEVGSLRRALSSAEARTRRRLWFVRTLSLALSQGSLPFGASLPWFLGLWVFQKDLVSTQFLVLVMIWV